MECPQCANMRNFFISDLLSEQYYITVSVYVLRPARTRAASVKRRVCERDAACCIKFRSYSVMFCPIASDLCVFRFFVINGLPGESICSATRKCFTLYLTEILSYETISYPCDGCIYRFDREFRFGAQYLAQSLLGPFGINESCPLQLTASYARLL